MFQATKLKFEFTQVEEKPKGKLRDESIAEEDEDEEELELEKLSEDDKPSEDKKPSEDEKPASDEKKSDEQEVAEESEEEESGEEWWRDVFAEHNSTFIHHCDIYKKKCLATAAAYLVQIRIHFVILNY